MARPLRLEFSGAVYHITARGNGRNDIFLNDSDRERFLYILADTVQRYNWLCHAYCLMDNHYHLLIETPDPNLSAGMRQLNGVYTQSFNRIHDRVGHVLQGRFKSIIVEKDSHLLELCRYIVLNPVRAGIVDTADQFQWSSYNATTLNQKGQEFLTIHWLLRQFSKDVVIARKRYKDFVHDGIAVQQSPWDHLTGQVFLGSKKFAEKMQTMIGHKQEIKEIPKTQRLASRPVLDELLAHDMIKQQRNSAITEAHIRYGYTLKEIGDYLDIHYSTVSRAVKTTKDRM